MVIAFVFCSVGLLNDLIDLLRELLDDSKRIADLHDDELLEIFSHLNLADRLNLGSVCRQWRRVSNEYVLMSGETAVGLTTNGNHALNAQGLTRCPYDGHQVRPKSVIGYMFDLSCQSVADRDKYERMYNPGKVFFGKFDLATNKEKLTQVLTRCPDVKSLVLKYSRGLNADILDTIGELCPNLEHFDLSYSTVDCDANSWNRFAGRVCRTLKCLHLRDSRGVKEDCLAAVVRKCAKLEYVTVTLDLERVGTCFRYFGANLTSLTVDVEESDDTVENGIRHAFGNLADSAGYTLKELNMLGDLTTTGLEYVCGPAECKTANGTTSVNRFPKLTSLSVYGDFWDIDPENDYREIVQYFDRMSQLDKLTIDIPLRFAGLYIDDTIADILSKCLNLKEFRLTAWIHDVTFAQIAKHCTHLEKLELRSPMIPMIPNVAADSTVQNLTNLKKLKYLTLMRSSLSDKEFVPIVEKSDSIRSLDLRDNASVGMDTLRAVVTKAANKPDEWFRIYLSNTSVQPADVAELMESVSMPKNLVISFDDYETGCEYDCRNVACQYQGMPDYVGDGMIDPWYDNYASDYDPDDDFDVYSDVWDGDDYDMEGHNFFDQVFHIIHNDPDDDEDGFVFEEEEEW